jgi:Cu+-exporting ATPase
MLDPICDMTVEPVRVAGKFDYDGATFYFCSVHCQKLF